MSQIAVEEFFNQWDPQKIEIWEEGDFYLAQYPPALLPEALRGFYTVKILKEEMDPEEVRPILAEKLRKILQSRASFLQAKADENGR